MKKVNITYSLKNIPSPSKELYKKKLVEQIEKFLKRLRWKHFFTLNPKLPGNKNTFGFKTENIPQQHKELKPFEDSLMNMAANIKFKNASNIFQKQMRNDCENIRNSQNIFVNADKTSNIYSLDLNQYNKLLTDNISSEYKKTDIAKVEEVNKEA